jgi:glucose-1-phosphate thymidylyltransferase
VEQTELLGQAHALWLAREHMEGPLFTFFVDTLFDGADFSNLDKLGADGIVFTKEVYDPRPFGAAEVGGDGHVVKLIEKPTALDNKKVMMGLYYFKEGASLARACEGLIERGRQFKGEYFLSGAVNVMIESGAVFETREVERWLDTGRPDTTLHANRYLLDHGHDNSPRVQARRSVIIPPVYVAPDAVVEDAVVGPYADVGTRATIRKAVVSNSIVDANAVVENIVLEGSLIGENAQVKGEPKRLNIGDSGTAGFEYVVDESWM